MELHKKKTKGRARGRRSQQSLRMRSSSSYFFHVSEASGPLGRMNRTTGTSALVIHMQKRTEPSRDEMQLPEMLTRPTTAHLTSETKTIAAIVYFVPFSISQNFKIKAMRSVGHRPSWIGPSQSCTRSGCGLTLKVRRSQTAQRTRKVRLLMTSLQDTLTVSVLRGLHERQPVNSGSCEQTNVAMNVRT